MSIFVFLFVGSAALMILSGAYRLFGRTVSAGRVLLTYALGHALFTIAYAMALFGPDSMLDGAMILVTAATAVCGLTILSAATVPDRAPLFTILGVAVVGMAAQFFLTQVIDYPALKAAGLILVVAAIWLILPPSAVFRRVAAGLVLVCAALLFCVYDWALLGLALLLMICLPVCLFLVKDGRAVLRARASGAEETLDYPGFVKLSAPVLSALQTQGLPMTVLLINVDGLSGINEKYGTQFGNEALSLLEQVIRGALRGGDILGRHVTGEFAVVLPRVLPATGVGVTDRIRGQLKNRMLPEHPDFRLTVSVGVTGGVTQEAQTVDSYIDRAAKALYEAKTTGRDKVVVLAME